MGFNYIFDETQFELSERYTYQGLEIASWKKEDGEFVNQGDIVFTLRQKFLYTEGKLFIQKASESGYLNKIRTAFDFERLKNGELIYSITDSDENRQSLKYTNVPSITFDDFTQKKIITWKRVGANDGYHQAIKTYSLDAQISLLFTFNFSAGRDHIVFYFYPKEIKLTIGDAISFLFENGEVAIYTITERPTKASHPYIKGLNETRVLISDIELNIFASHKTVKWKINLNQENREILGGVKGYGGYESANNLSIVVKKLATEYHDLVRKEIENYTPLVLEKNPQPSNLTSEHCYVYLMHDIVNGFYKIGISNQPEWRERTLQSEKPTIELIASKIFINRKIASAIEKALHFTYSNKRLRGEWFALENLDVAEIIDTLKS